MKRVTLAVACALGAFAGSARAEIVPFTNPAPGQPGHYDWRPVVEFGSFLDITLTPESQTNVVGGNSVAQRRIDYYFGGIIDDSGYVNGHQAWGDEQLASVLAVPDLWTAALTPGQEVDAANGLLWSPHARHASVPPVMSQFPLGQRRYVGVRTINGNHGWIEVERGGAGDPLSLTASAWAYETEPGVPIHAGQIPGPGAGLALTGGALLRSRRRRLPAESASLNGR